MGSFEKAFRFTASWEGGFDGNRQASSQPLDDSVAVYGITPKFLYDYLGWSKSDATSTAKLTAINYAKAAQIWQQSRWTWFKCAQIQNDDIATLVFDMAVRRANAAARWLASAVGLSESQGTIASGRQGILPSQATINRINLLCRYPGSCEALYQKIIQTYISNTNYKEIGLKTRASLPDGIIRRLGSLLVVDFNISKDTFPSLPKAKQTSIKNKVLTVRSSAIAGTAQATGSSEQATGHWLLWGVTVFVGGKFLKWW